VSSDTNYATVSIAGGVLTINAKPLPGQASGTAVISLRDNTPSTLTIALTIASTPLSISPNSGTAIIGDVMLANILGGTPPYTVSVGNKEVAEAKIINNNVLQMSGLQVGQTIVTVLDSGTTTPVSFNLTVNAGTPEFRLSPNALTISEGQNVSGGVTLIAYGAALGTLKAYSSDVSRVRANDGVVTVAGGTGSIVLDFLSTCVDANTTVAITVVDSKGSIGKSTITITNNLTSATACNATNP